MHKCTVTHILSSFLTATCSTTNHMTVCTCVPHDRREGQALQQIAVTHPPPTTAAGPPVGVWRIA